MDTGIVFGTNELIVSAIFALVLVVVFFRPSKKRNRRDQDE